MVSGKKLSLAAAAAILGFSSEGLANSGDTTTDFAIRADSADSGVQGEFVLRSIDEDTLADVAARDLEELGIPARRGDVPTGGGGTGGGTGGKTGRRGRRNLEELGILARRGDIPTGGGSTGGGTGGKTGRRGRRNLEELSIRGL